MATMDRAARRDAILAVVARIPSGKVCSYGRVADIAGLACGAREVGRVLGQLASGSTIPWHRVLNAQGKIHNAVGSEAGRMQSERLRDEGVMISNGKVNMKTFGWLQTVDELLWSDPDAWHFDPDQKDPP